MKITFYQLFIILWISSIILSKKIGKTQKVMQNDVSLINRRILRIFERISNNNFSFSQEDINKIGSIEMSLRQIQSHRSNRLLKLISQAKVLLTSNIPNNGQMFNLQQNQMQTFQNLMEQIRRISNNSKTNNNQS